MSKYPRGSVWRRWDLHVHTPASIIQQYGGNTPKAWDEFLKRLAALPADVQVIAINDYLFIDGYEQLLARRSEIPNIVQVIPSIEFRLNTFSGTAKSNRRHNFHVLFDPSISPQIIREQLLNCLSTAYLITDKTEWNQTPTPTSLSALGALVKKTAPAGNTVHSKSDLEVGFDNITYKREDILKHLEKDCFKGRYLTAIGYSEWDQAKWDQSAVEKRDLINRADFSLLSNDNVAKIEEHRQQLRTDNLNSLILHSSDAHALDRLGQTKLWLKADPTFAGLKHVINEHDRVFLGDAAPQLKAPHRVIESLVIRDSQGWFSADATIPLNDSLVAIIGGRGSGKSALAEMVGAAAGIFDPSHDSFINKAKRHASGISGTKVEIHWMDGSTTPGNVDTILEENEDLIKYLPQKSIELLCAPENSSTLLAQIENVIFQALDDTVTLGASDFAELRERLSTGYEFEKAEAHSTIRALNARYQALMASVDSLPSKRRDLTSKQKDLAKLKAELPQLPAADEKAQEELARYQQLKKDFEDRIVDLRRMQERIAAIQTRIRVFEGTLKAFAGEMAQAAKDVGVIDPSPFAVSLDTSSMTSVLSTRTAELTAVINQLRTGTRAEASAALATDGAKWPTDNLETLAALITRRTNETKAFESAKLKYQRQKSLIAAAERTIEALEKEIHRIDTETKVEFERVRESRFEKYESYFLILGKEQTEISKLYQPLQKSLEEGSDTDRRLRFEARITFDLTSHLTAGLAILDRTKRGNFRDVDALKKALDEMAVTFKAGGYKKAALRMGLIALWKEFIEIDSDGQTDEMKVRSQLRDGTSLQAFFDWFLDVDCFKVESSLTFDDTELELLSPGKKGIVLLMLYLAMDNADTRPLVIDQPEDNLDNLSVYSDLIHLFKHRKRFRQILLVTHNPNLVVNTDAEQIVIARFDGKNEPRIEYATGSLENLAEAIPNVAASDLEDGILEQVCSVLEGGSSAFNRRARVYILSPKISME